VTVHSPLSPTYPAQRLARFSAWLARTWPALLIVGAGFGLRLWSLDFSRDAPRARPDEELFVQAALGLFSDDKNPHYLVVGWPELFFFMIHGAQRLLAWWLTLRTDVEVNLACLYGVDPIRLTVLGRIISCALGTATIPLTMALAQRATKPSAGPAAARLAGLLAGAFIAFDYLHVRDSHFGVTDTTVTFLMTAVLWGLTRVLDRGSLRDYIVTAALLALAASVKYTACSMVPVCLLAVGWRVALRGGRLRALEGAGVALLVGAAVFIAANPHLLDDLDGLYRGLLSHEHRYSQGGARYNYDTEAPLQHGLGYHFMFTLPASIGVPLLVLGIAGVVRSLARPYGPSFAIAFFVLLFYFAVTGPSTSLFVRYTTPIHPSLCALAAIALTEILERFARPYLSARLFASLTALAATALVAQLVVRDIQSNLLLSRPDTRDLAREWLLAHMRPGETMVTQGGYAQVHALDISTQAACQAALPAALRRPMPLLSGTSPAESALAREGPRKWGDLGKHVSSRYVGLDDPNADWLVQGEPIHRCGKRGRSDGLRALGACYQVAAVIPPGAPSCDTLYDTFDSYFGPFAGDIGSVQHLGPQLTIWQNICRTKAGAKRKGQDSSSSGLPSIPSQSLRKVCST
jgi:hypothetical protein